MSAGSPCFNLTMDRGRFAQLEALRGFAATYVVVHHVISMLDLHPWAALPFRFGQEAVVLFFLISGFVIHHGHTGDLRAHFRARMARIYPVFLAALVLSYGVACAVAGRALPVDAGQLLGNLLMLQHREGAVAPFMGNGALWTLSYEAFFYLAYPLLMRAARPHVMALSLSMFGFLLLTAVPFHGFSLAAYLMIWWTGVALREAHDGRWRPLRMTLAANGIAFLILAAFAARTPFVNFGHFPYLELRHFGGAWVIAGVLLAWSRWNWLGFRWTIGHFATFAAPSYALYAIHFPIVRAAPALPLPPWIAVAMMIAVAMIAAHILEQACRSMRNRRSRPHPQDVFARIAMGAVVHKDVPPGAFVAGNPARVVKRAG